MELLVRQWGCLNRCFPNGPLSAHRIIITPRPRGVGTCVCWRAWPLCAPFASGSAICQYRGTACVFVCVLHVFMCECITYVGVKKCYIFNSCCLSLLIDAQQQWGMALAGPLKRRALTHLRVGEMFFAPRPPSAARHIFYSQFAAFFLCFYLHLGFQGSLRFADTLPVTFSAKTQSLTEYFNLVSGRNILAHLKKN